MHAFVIVPQVLLLELNPGYSLGQHGFAQKPSQAANNPSSYIIISVVVISSFEEKYKMKYKISI